MKYLDSLTTLGLTKDQAKIYEILLSAPLLPVRLISSKSGVSRELAYVVLGQLEQIGLVERSTQGKVILFRAEHPRMIKKILEEKHQKFLEAEKAYQDIIGIMVSDFNVTHNKPFIRFYEGLEGLQKTYEHILRHAKTVYVIRSLYDYDNPELRSMVTEQLEKQVAKNIQSYVLTPKLDHMKPEKVVKNIKRNITRKIVSKDLFTLPSQIIIYNSTVSITSMKGAIVTTIIENQDIATTFLNLFNYMWSQEE